MDDEFNYYYHRIVEGTITPEKWREYVNTLTDKQKINYLDQFAEYGGFRTDRGEIMGNILEDSINVWNITPGDVKELLNSYIILIELAIKAKHFDMFWYIIKEVGLSTNVENVYIDRSIVHLTIENVIESNYMRFLELLYIYFTEIRKYDRDTTLDEKLFIRVWDNIDNVKSLKYVILFICKIRKITVKELLNTYLSKYSIQLEISASPILNWLPSKIGEAETFYNAFLEAGVSLSYFQEIQDINNTIPIWLSEIQEDI